MPDTTRPGQRWTLRIRDRDHRVEVVPAGLGRRITWTVDGEVVAERKTSDDKVRLTASDTDLHPDLGAVALRFAALGGARRVTWFEPEGDLDAGARAAAGLGGVDLVPEPGSPAARREERIRLHPRRYAATQTGLGVAKAVAPILLTILFARLAFSLPIPRPDWDLPRLPGLPWPDVAWPDLDWPGIPWPDWQLPAWVREVASKAKYVWPVVLAYVLARAEIRRRRRQDELRADRDESEPDETAGKP